MSANKLMPNPYIPNPGTPIPLKTSAVEGRCNAKGCTNDSEMIDGTKRLSDSDVPLCMDCWERSDEVPLP